MNSFRKATLKDIDALLVIENTCFETDRLTRRNFRWMLTKAHGELIVAQSEDKIAGYILILFHKGTSLARVYSLAMLPDYRGQGIARGLLKEAEEAALQNDCIAVRLEVRPDNQSAIRLYEDNGYHFFSLTPHYYEDDSEALRYQKRVLFPSNINERGVPYYRQTTEFTCGPSCLIMAMAAHDRDISVGPQLELRLWREATTIFMTSGHGGCSAHGLALAAHDRGFGVRLFINASDTPFIDSVRGEAKKKVLRLVHEDFQARIEQAKIAEETFGSAIATLESMMDEGGVPMVLISSYRLTGEKAPHWVVISRMDERFVYVNDPEVDTDIGKTETDCVEVPIRRSDFEKMAQYGRSQLKAIVVVFNKQNKQGRNA